MDVMAPVHGVEWIPYVLDDGTEFVFRIEDGAVIRTNEATGAALMEPLGRDLTHLAATADGRTLVAAGDGFARVAHVDIAHLGDEDGLVPWGFDVSIPAGTTCVGAIKLHPGEATGVVLVTSGPERSAYVCVRQDGRHVTTPAEHHRELAAAGVSEDRQVIDDLGTVVHHTADAIRDGAARRQLGGRVLSIDAVVVDGRAGAGHRPSDDQVLHLTLLTDQDSIGFVLGVDDAAAMSPVAADVRCAQLTRGLTRVPEAPAWAGVWVETAEGPMPLARTAERGEAVEEMFNYDVFISYKRDDPTAPSADDVERLAGDLVARLEAARLSDGRSIRCWIDRREATGRYGITARQAIYSSATFAVLWNHRSTVRSDSSGPEQINQWEEVALIRRVLEDDQLHRGVRQLAVWQANRGDDRGRVEMPGGSDERHGLGTWQVTKARPVDGVDPPDFDEWVDSVIEQVERSRRRQLPDKTEMV